MMMSSVPPERNPQWTRGYPSSPPFKNNTNTTTTNTNNNTTSNNTDETAYPIVKNPTNETNTHNNFYFERNSGQLPNRRPSPLHSSGQQFSSPNNSTTNFNQQNFPRSTNAVDIEADGNGDWDFTLLSNTHMSANSEGTFHPMVLADKNSSLHSSSIGSETGGFPPLLTGLPDHKTNQYHQDDDEAPSPTALSEDGELSHMVKGVAGLLDDEEDDSHGNLRYHQQTSPFNGGFQSSPLPDGTNMTLSPVPTSSWNIEDGMFEFEENISSPLPPNGMPRTPPPTKFLGYERENLGQHPVMQPAYSPHTNHSPSAIYVSNSNYSHTAHQPQYHHYHTNNNNNNNNNKFHNHSHHRGRGKTVCKFFLQGNCKAGDNCKFSHDINIRGSPSSRSSSLSPLQSLSPSMEYPSFVSDDTQSLESSTSGSNGSNPNAQSVCKFYLQGNCRKGDRCPFRHEVAKPNNEYMHRSPQSSPLQQPTSPIDPVSVNYSRSNEAQEEIYSGNSEDNEKSRKRESPGAEQPKLCPFFINGECRYGTKCRFVHLNLDPSDERRIKLAEESRRKQSTIPCKYYDFGKGVCPYGDECYFVHVDLTVGNTRDHQLYLCCDADGNFTDVGSRTLSDFVANAEQGNGKSPSLSSFTPHKKRAKRSKSRKRRS